MRFTIKMMKIKINKNILLLFLVVISCKSIWGKSFNEFISKAPCLSLPVNFVDSIELNEFDNAHFIDTTYVLNYKLINSNPVGEYSLTRISENKCSYVGKILKGNYFYIICKYFTSFAGNGAPEMIIAAFNKNGKKIDSQLILWQDPTDPFYSNRIVCTMDTTLLISVKSTASTFGFMLREKKIVAKKIVEKELKYSFDSKIKKYKCVNNTSKILLENNDSLLLDHFPE
jgi:hypothetical protein